MSRDGTSQAHASTTEVSYASASGLTASSTNYRRIEIIAHGGMGRVELVARQEGRFRRLYAFKRLHPHLIDEDFESMFFDEARIAGLIDHPNVVSVLDVGRDHEGPYLVMPYVHGLSLAQLIKLACNASFSIPAAVVARIGLDVARGLHAAHEVRSAAGELLGLVHRDVSPQNILVGFDGVARITDFGVAKALGQSTRTSTGVAKGKHSYMSPEQIRLAPLDRRSDLFSLGVVLFEALTQARLYSGAGTDGPQRILEEPPPDVGELRQDVPPAMVELLFDLLAKRPEDRPADAAEVVTRLERVLAEEIAAGAETSVEAVLDHVASPEREKLDERQRRALSLPLESAPTMRPPTHRVRWLLAGLALSGIAAAVIAIAVWGLPAPAPDPPAEASARPERERVSEATIAGEPGQGATTIEPAPSERGPSERAEAPEAVSAHALPSTPRAHARRGSARAARGRRGAASTRSSPSSDRVGWDGEER
ncbi:MAG: serine/threonine-protein kinase [Sandaracinaceae bacterium]